LLLSKLVTLASCEEKYCEKLIASLLLGKKKKTKTKVLVDYEANHQGLKPGLSKTSQSYHLIRAMFCPPKT
jgi:hypothetical protein